MLAEPLARMLARRGIHYGWVVAATAFLVMLSTAAAVGMPGVLIRPLQHEYGWSLSGISGPLALRLVLFGAMAPWLEKRTDDHLALNAATVSPAALVQQSTAYVYGKPE